MSTVALLIRVEARPGSEAALAAGLGQALNRLRVHANAGGWTCVQLGPSTFGIFDTRPRLIRTSATGTIVQPGAVLVGLEHLIVGSPQVAHPTRRLRPSTAAEVPLLPISQRLF